MMCKLSIITVNLNNKVGLQKTIDSVISQTNRDFEFVIIDGDSTDGSKDLFIHLRYNNFSWISEKDNGIFNAMNKGIRLASGEYLLFLNSGDYFVDNNIVEKFIEFETTNDIICGKCNLVNKNKIVHTTIPPDFVTLDTLINIGINHQSTFIKKKIFDNFGLYDETFKYNADVEFWVRTIILGNATVQNFNQIICNYNLEGISSTEHNSEIFKNEIERIFTSKMLKRIYPDYLSKYQLDKELEGLYWIKSKKFLWGILNLIYSLAKFITKNKRK